MNRPLYRIASDIYDDWDPVNFAAVPYLEAMTALGGITDSYGYDDAETVVLYFLANAQTWRGARARAIKAELKGMTRNIKRASK